MSHKKIVEAVKGFKEKFAGHEGLTIGMLWIWEFINYLRESK